MTCELQNMEIPFNKPFVAGLKPLANNEQLSLPEIPGYATNNAHIFYLICRAASERTDLSAHLKKDHINSAFHYFSLHKSPFYFKKHDGRELPNADRFSDCLLRLPMYCEMKDQETQRVIDSVNKFFR